MSAYSGDDLTRQPLGGITQAELIQVCYTFIRSAARIVELEDELDRARRAIEVLEKELSSRPSGRPPSAL